MELPKYKVYVKTDDDGVIIRCEGGATEPKDLTGWRDIDEGSGDKYYLCQARYFDGGLYTADGVSRWKLENNAPILRTDDEIEADREARRSNQTQELDYDALLVDHEYRLTLLELGV